MPYLVRHAHAGDKRAWQGPDSLRPLSAAGGQEAHGLLTQLRDYPISRILSSPAVRCQQTVQPLAERRDLRVETADALGVDADSTGLVALLLDPAASETVLCSHGELIGAGGHHRHVHRRRPRRASSSGRLLLIRKRSATRNLTQGSSGRERTRRQVPELLRPAKA